MANFGTKVEHPAFGMIGYSHRQGETNLFQVDYPQGHYITLRLYTAVNHEDESQDRPMAREMLAQVSMSEVQWASFIANPNRGDGVPCTLDYYHDPRTGEFLSPKITTADMSRVEKSRQKIAERADGVTDKVAVALAEVERMLAGGPIKKSEMQGVKDILFKAAQDLHQNIPYLVERIDETIDGAVADGKAQVDAHADFVIRRLGERALGERLAEAIGLGVDAADVGARVLTVFDGADRTRDDDISEGGPA